jgi:hypothetical protein
MRRAEESSMLQKLMIQEQLLNEELKLRFKNIYSNNIKF